MVVASSRTVVSVRYFIAVIGWYLADVLAQASSSASIRCHCSVRVPAAAKPCTPLTRLLACGVPRLMASRKSRNTPLPPISGRARAASVSGMVSVNSR